MRNLVRGPCMDSEQHTERRGKNCPHPSRSAVRSLVFFAVSTHPARALIALPSFYSTPRGLETSAITGKQAIATHPNQLFLRRAARRECLGARQYSSLTPHSTNLGSQLPIHSSLITHHSALVHLPASAVSAKVSGMASLIQEVGETFFTLYKGFSVTLRTMFRKTTTESFPDAPPTVQPRYRGIHVLQRDEHGYEKCVGCFLCAAACPANCIYIEAHENTAANRISAGERYAKVYNIDYSRCIFCGYCVEACPTDAITHGHSIELAPYNINALIYRKEQLLEPWPPRTKQ
jgi:NADH-quinone oxidoreductase subunit I